MRSKLLLACLGLWLLNCGKTEVAGGAGSETTNGIQISTSKGSPAAYARLIIRPQSYVASQPEILQLGRYADTSSDAKGILEVPVLDSGYYTLVADHQGEIISATLQVDHSGNASLVLDGKATRELKLGKPALFVSQIELPSGIEYAMMRLYGTDFEIKSDDHGLFVFDSLPFGDHAIQIRLEDSDEIYLEQRLTLRSGQINQPEIKGSSYLTDASLWSYTANIQADKLLRNSALESAPHWNIRTMPFLLLVDSNDLDFSKVNSNDPDMLIHDALGNRVPHQIRWWKSNQALIWVQLEGANQNQFPLRLAYGKSGILSNQDSAGVWQHLSASEITDMLTINIEDFESQQNVSPIFWQESPLKWHISFSFGATATSPATTADYENAIKSTLPDWPGYAMHYEYSAEEPEWAYMGLDFAEHHSDFRHLDSVTFDAKGSGLIRLALENGLAVPITKAWRTDTLSATWKHFNIQIDDFDSPSDGENLGWTAVQHLITKIGVFGYDGNEFWIDNIKLYGIHPLELRE
jgi:hypothetical protein